MNLIIRHYGENVNINGGEPTIIKLIVRNVNPAGGSGGVGGYISAGSTIMSLGTAVFSNANGVTFGADGQTITASFSGGTGGGGGAAISAGGNSQSTGTVVFSNSNGVSFGLSNNGVLTASHNGITSQSNQAFSAQGGSSAFQTLVFTNSNGISFSNTNGSLWGSVRTDYQSSGNYLITAMQSGASTQFVQANAVFAGTNASGTIASNGISISVNTAAPGAGITNINLSAGSTSNNASNFTFADSNGVSFGLNAGTITATVKTDYQTSGNYLTTAMLSNAATISNINVSGGTTSSNLSAIKFIDSNGVSWSLDTGSKVYATVRTDYQSAGAYLTTAMLSNAGSNFVNTSAGVNLTNISATFNSNSISLSVAAAQTGISGIVASDTTYTSGTISFKDGNGISFASTTGQAISITHGLQFTSATSAITSNALNTIAARIQGVIGSNTTYTSGSVGFRDLNGITWQSTTGQSFQVTHDLQYTSATSAITSNALNTSASRVINIIAATNNTGGGTASLSSNVSFSNANGLTFYTSAGNAIVGSYSVPTITNSSFSVQDSATTINPVNRIAFSTGNNITLSLSTGASSVTVGVAHNLAGTSTGFGGNLISATITNNSSGLNLSLNHPAWLTTARASTDGIGLNTAQTNVTWTVNSSGLSLNAGGYAGTNTATTGGISVTLNTSGISLNIGAYITTAAQSNQVINSINGSTGVFSFNTGSSLSSSRNGNSITWGLASDITTALQSTGAYLTTARASTDAIGLNTAQTNVTWTVNSGGLSFNAGGYAGTNTTMTGGSVTLNTSGISINIPGSSVSMWPAQPEVISSTATLYSGSATASNGTATTMSALLFPVVIEQNLVFNNVRVWASNSIVTSIASSLTYVQGISLGLYTLNGANLSLVSSFTNTLRYVQSTSNVSANSSVGITMGWGNSSTTFQTGNSSNFSSLAVSISGAKMYPLNWTSSNRTLTVGQYFAMLMFSYSTSNSAAGTLQSIGVVNKNLTLPQECMKATSVTVQGWPFLGIFSLTINSNSLLPSLFATSDLTTATNSTSNFATSGFLQMYSF